MKYDADKKSYEEVESDPTKSVAIINIRSETGIVNMKVQMDVDVTQLQDITLAIVWLEDSLVLKQIISNSENVDIWSSAQEDLNY